MPDSSAGPALVNVPLTYPVAYEGTTITEVRLRRPRVSDMMAAQSKGSSAADLELAMIAEISGVPVAALLQLDMQDYLSIQAALRAFGAGRTPS